MNMIANHMEQKYHYEAKGKIIPYRASAIGIATGRMKTTKDIMRTGAYLGAKGSFNVTTDPPGLDPNTQWNESDFILSDDPLLNAISDTVENDNRYAWRLNCESGWNYGLDPEDFETRDEYQFALDMAKSDQGEDLTETPSVAKYEEESDKEPDDEVLFHVHCQVSRLDNGKTEGFWIDNPAVKVGDIVELAIEDGIIQGVVVAIDKMQD